MHSLDYRFLKEVSLNLANKRTEILRVVPKIKGNPDCFLLKDLAVVYKEFFNKKFDIQLFTKNFKEIQKIFPFAVVPFNDDDYFVLYAKESNINIKEIKEKQKELSNKKYILVDDSDSEMIEQKINDRIYGSENKELSIDKNISKAYDDISSDNECINNKTNKNKAYDDISSDSECINNKTNKTDNKNTGKAYDDISTESVEIVTKFKTPFKEAKKKDNKLTASLMKDKINAAFSNKPVIPIDCFHTAFCEVHGKGINLESAPCHLPKHVHPTISKYLRCFSDLVDLKMLNKLYVINISNEMLKYTERRFLSYSNDLNKLNIEALCVNLFSTKITLFFSDFLEIFKTIYKNPIETIIKNNNPQEYLCNLRSPNIIIVKKNNNYSMTICPIFHSSYVEWEDPEKHRKIYEIENRISENKKSEVVVSSLCNISSYQILNKEKDLLNIADLNIPRKIQIQCNLKEPVEFNDLWMYLQVNVNFNGQRGFFY